MRTVCATSMLPGSQGEWTGMHMREQWWLHCTSQSGRKMLLSEQVCCVAITFKMTEQVEERICIKFCVKLEHSSTETIQMDQKAAPMGSWWSVASSWPCTDSYIMSCAECFGETSNHPGDSVPPTAQVCHSASSGFSQKLKSPLKGKISDHQWDSGKYDEAADGDWENCVRSQGA